ncbi:MAG: class A beta-lactamase-related serine hydrolase [Candidatus Kapaibacterium sp.]|nr:MAG: class A beta-lactamase-related serine hydrolase [Candidatus Kapabacteria bacterium]
MKKLPLTILFCAMSTSLFAQTNDNVDAIIQKEMTARKITGLQLAVVKNGKLVKTGNYGYANLQDSIPVDQNTLFTINSITKAFTGVAIMQLVEEGKIDLQAPISKYVDGLPISWQNVTIRQLASNISGIPNVMDGNGKLIADGEVESWQKVKTLPNEFRAGEQFSYSQTNYVLLKKAIEKVCGMSFEDVVKKQQWEKAGMKSTLKFGFGDFYDIPYHAARGYTYFVNGNLTNIHPEIFPPFVRAAAGMQSTAIEIANWLIALQKLEIVKKKETLDEMWTPSRLTNGKTAGFGDVLNGYGIGWLTALRTNNPAVVSVGGGRSAVVVYRNEDVSVVVLTNLQGASPEYFIDQIAKNYLSTNK